jgi:tetratricopeptide (TPR) repeat protein
VKTEEVFKEMLSISKNDEEKALAHFGLGMMYGDLYGQDIANKKYFDMSKENFEKVIALNPNFLSPNIVLSYIYELNDDIDHAIEVLENAKSRIVWSKNNRERLEKDLKKLKESTGWAEESTGWAEESTGWAEESTGRGAEN